MVEPDSFYVGYGRVPAPLRRWLRIAVPALLVIAGLAIGAFAAAQHPFADSAFEFGKATQLTGVYVADPHPALMIHATPANARGATALARVHLVGEGKLGARLDVAQGDYITLSGTLIERAQQTMLEVTTGSVQIATADSHPVIPDPAALGAAQLVGEIVDSKCHLGVMKPGHGTAHRACAIRCISGGLPPMLVSRDANGHTQYVLLSDTSRNIIGDWLLPFVGKPVRVQGALEVRNGATYLNISDTGVTLL